MIAPPRHSAPLAEALAAATVAVAEVLGGHPPEPRLEALPADRRPAVRDLAYGTLRDFGRGDFLLARLMAKPPRPPALHALLLVALHRLEARPAKAHTTVDQAVVAARRLGRGRWDAVANGVLRNFLRRRDELLAAAEADPVAAGRHPAWWLSRLHADHPRDWRGIVAAGNLHPPMSLRINRRRATGADIAARLESAGIAFRWLGEHALRLERPVAVERLPGFAEGLCSVQDFGAQQAAPLLDVADGLRVLDACAAPGGKTAHLLEVADLDLVALDADPARVPRIAANLARLGLAAATRTADCRDLPAWWDGRPFDRILADVPCSASGVARRHPDAKWLRREADVARFARTQAAILDALWQVLAPGGKMLHATCSVFAAENTEQVDAFVRRHADARRVPTGGADEELRLLPTADRDGFFYALLEKR